MQPTPAADSDVLEVAAANTGFGFRLLKLLSQETPDGNVFFSPFSVSQALSLTLNGAGGATKASIAAALGLRTLPFDRVNHANARLLPSLTLDPKVQVSVANALWADIGTTFGAEFQDRCRKFYDARADTLDFSKPSAADTINGWVEESTNGKIDRLVSADDLISSPTVLTNAVYFRGLWTHEFDERGTRSRPFTLASGETKVVPLMTQEEKYPYLETADFQAISLPYGQGHMSLYIFLLAQKSGLNEFIAGLDENTWSEWISKMLPTKVVIRLPRFKADFLVRLKGPLCALGMTSAFRRGADFKPMGLREGFIGDVIHKAVLEVEEKGTVAAAATAVGMMRDGVPNPDIIMEVNRPFFCAIRDNATGTLLFAGVIRDPQ